MLLNSINSKINLPGVVAKLGASTSEYDFVRVPLFGWYAKSKISDFVGNVFDFFPIADWKKLYRVLCRDFSDCFDFKLSYSEFAERSLYKDQTKIMQYQSAWLMSVQEAESARARFHDKVVYFKDMLDALGMPALIPNKFGYLTERVVKNFPVLELDVKYRYKKTLLIPTFCSPKHICSLEVAKLGNLHERETLFLNGEYGWYGRAGVEIVKDINELKVKIGNTWNSKNDYWNKDDIRLSELLSTEQLIKIWSESEHSNFSENIENLMLCKQGDEDLRKHIASLDHSQVQQLEKKTGQDLMGFWMRSREEQFSVQGRTYVKRDKAYYLVKNSGEEQLTNFVIDIKQIRKKNEEEFIWCGMIYFKEHAVPFELEDRYFTSCFLFARGIRKLFLTLGLGIPFINEKYVKQLMTMIQLTCHDVAIVPIAAKEKELQV